MSASGFCNDRKSTLDSFLNLGILQMTEEMTKRFNGITLFGMVLFWQKIIEYFTEFIIHFFTDKVERFYTEFYCLLVLLIFFRPGWNDQWMRIIDGYSIDSGVM